MAIAVFKDKTFQVSSNKIYTFNGFTWGGDIQAEDQEKLNSKPSTYIKGVGLNTMSFEIPLKTILGMDVRLEIEEWEAIKEATQPAIFILGSKPLGANKWLLKSTNVSNSIIDNNGVIVEATLKLEFQEFVRQGSAENASGGKATKEKAAAVNVELAPNDYIFNPTDKAEQKRNNPNVTASISDGRRGIRAV